MLSSSNMVAVTSHENDIYKGTEGIRRAFIVPRFIPKFSSSTRDSCLSGPLLEAMLLPSQMNCTSYKTNTTFTIPTTEKTSQGVQGEKSITLTAFPTIFPKSVISPLEKQVQVCQSFAKLNSRIHSSQTKTLDQKVVKPTPGCCRGNRYRPSWNVRDCIKCPKLSRSKRGWCSIVN